MGEIDGIHSRLQNRAEQDASEGSERGAIAPIRTLGATPASRHQVRAG